MSREADILGVQDIVVSPMAGWIGRVEIGQVEIGHMEKGPVERGRQMESRYVVTGTKDCFWERFGAERKYRVAWYGRLPDELMPHAPYMRPNLLSTREARGRAVYVIWEPLTAISKANKAQWEWWAAYIQPLVDAEAARDLEWALRDPAEIRQKMRGLEARMTAPMREPAEVPPDIGPTFGAGRR